MTTCYEHLTSRPAADLAAKVAQRARGINAFVGRMEILAGERRLSRTDIERAYTGAFLSFFTFYERSWEDLFFGLLMKRFTLPTSVQPLVDIRSEQVARKIVRGRTTGYITWFPVEHTIERASLFLSKGKPFDSISGIERGQLQRTLVVRNALAHDSREALRKFDRSVIGQRTLPKSELRPAGYLRGIHAANQSRMNLSMAELTILFTRLCN